MSEEAPSFLVERANGVGFVTLNRPDQLNAVNNAIRSGLPAALRELDADPSVAVMVVRGAPGRAFCAGADVKEMRAPDSVIAERRRMINHAWIDNLDKLNKPVIASIHGFCLGGGLELALACDIRIASADASFGLPETALGLIPGGGGTQRLPRVIGLGRALDLMLTGDRIKPEEALRIGLITRLVDTQEQLAEETVKLAERIAARPPLATNAVKEAVRSGFELDLATGLTLEKTLFALLQVTEDKIEATTAFKEKRKPVFKGK